jgi:hypothetical protein
MICITACHTMMKINVKTRKKDLIAATTLMGVVTMAAAVAFALINSTPAAFADDRYPPQEYHCYGNPHSDEKTGNPHDDGLNDKSNPHDGLRSDGGECVKR